MNTLSPTPQRSNLHDNCPNLLALCAGRWRVSRDPVAPPSDTSPYAQVLVGRLGEVYAVDRDRLAVECWDGHVALLIATALGGKLPWQRGEGLFCYLFPPDQLPTVAEVIGPRKVRPRECEQDGSAARVAFAE
jgi:hypothetical protein